MKVSCLSVSSGMVLLLSTARAFLGQNLPGSTHAASTITRTGSLRMLNILSSKPQPVKLDKLPPLEVPERFQTPPQPKPLSVTRLSSVPGLATGAAALVIRAGAGATVYGWKPEFGEAEDGEYSLKYGPFPELKDTSAEVAAFNKPKKPIVLYEYEASPYCRKVREACSMLDLTVDIKPCPRRGNPWRAELEEKTGQLQFPYMEDPNTGDNMFESDSIIVHLFENYGPGKQSIPAVLKGQLSVAGCGTASAIRGFGGGIVSPNAAAANSKRKPLTLYGYEGSPFVKPVRELLTGLELPHTMVFCARGSANRAKLMQKTGEAFQVPYLEDPNTEINMFESAEICEYLTALYSTK